MKKDVKKIVLTGGPCAGKTTACSWIQNYFSKQGYKVIFVPEVATEVISAGLDPSCMYSDVDYQTFITRMMLEKEKFYLDAIEKMPEDKFLVIFDRGIFDNLAYIDREGFDEVLKNNNLTIAESMGKYDCVLHLVTAANGAEEYYNLDNEARDESLEEARKLDERTLNGWVGHPHLRVINNSCNFEGKMQKVVTEIASFLGIPYPYEIERKYLISKVDLEYLKQLANCSKVTIEQVYLDNSECEERIRKRGNDGDFIYTRTKKYDVDGLKRVELEERITEEDYLRDLKRKRKDYGVIKKDRYCLMYNDTYFEIDVYPFMNDYAICEVEFNDDNENITFPPYINVIDEVTYNKEYKNGSLAQDILYLNREDDLKDILKHYSLDDYDNLICFLRKHKINIDEMDPKLLKTFVFHVFDPSIDYSTQTNSSSIIYSRNKKKDNLQKVKV